MPDEDHHSGSFPSDFLIQNVCLLPKGRALDIAMGHGRNAVFLAQNGFHVEGIDISEDAVRSASDFARSAGVDINARIADLEADFEIDRNAYDVIICFNYLHRPLFPQIKHGLKAGGMVVYETFTIDQAQFGKPRNPDHLLQYNELIKMFSELRCLRYREGIFNGPKATASIVAEKV